MVLKTKLLCIALLYVSYCNAFVLVGNDIFCCEIQEKSKDVKQQIDTINFKDYTLKIVSYFVNDTMSIDEPNQLFPVCIKQDVYCLKLGETLNKCNYKVRIIKQKLINGNRIKMIDNVITQIGIIEGSKGILFTIFGYGGCNSCSELYSIFSLNGEKIYFLYQQGQKEFKNFGDLKKICSQYGIVEDDFLSGNYRKKTLYLATQIME